MLGDEVPNVGVRLKTQGEAPLARPERNADAETGQLYSAALSLARSGGEGCVAPCAACFEYGRTKRSVGCRVHRGDAVRVHDDHTNTAHGALADLRGIHQIAEAIRRIRTVANVLGL